MSSSATQTTPEKRDKLIPTGTLFKYKLIPIGTLFNYLTVIIYLYVVMCVAMLSEPL